MRDRDRLMRLLEAFAPDTICHFAFVIDVRYKAINVSFRDEGPVHDINIGGTRNVCDCVDALRPARFLTTTSVVAFGASPGGVCPLAENSPREGDGAHVSFVCESTVHSARHAHSAGRRPKGCWPLLALAQMRATSTSRTC